MGIETDLLKGALVVAAAALTAWGGWELLGYICKLTKEKVKRWLIKHGTGLLEKLHEQLNRQGSLLNKGFKFVLEKLPGSNRAKGIIYGKRRDGSKVKLGETEVKIRDEAADELTTNKRKEFDFNANETDGLMAQLQ